MDYVQEMMAAAKGMDSFPPNETAKYRNLMNKNFHIGNAKWRYKKAVEAFDDGQYRRAKEFFEICLNIVNNVGGDCEEILGVGSWEIELQIEYLKGQTAMLQSVAATAA